MFENTKCECGHQNPPDTILCEACGKPLIVGDDKELLEMRYDGVNRHSQKQNPHLLNRVWNFFSSVKIAVYLIVITLLGSMLGTILPQENVFMNMDPSTYYRENYGTFGHLYYLLGLTHTFESWWFRTLLVMIGTSLVVCSLDRVLPLYRALSKQQIRKHLQFIMRQKVSYQQTLPDAVDEDKAVMWVNDLKIKLKKQGFRVHTDGSALLAEKNRFSRWGPYINHIGLILFLLAILARSIPGWHMDQFLAFPEGQAIKIAETPYYLKNEKFMVEYYTPEEMTEGFREQNKAVAKTYETKAILYECIDSCENPLQSPVLKEVHRQDIIVNKPLEYKGLLAYQFDFRETLLLNSVKPSLFNRQTGEEYGSFDLPMVNPPSTFTAGPFKLTLKGYFPDFGLDNQGKPITNTNEAKAPAFIFSITGPGLSSDGEIYMYFPRQIDKEQFRQDDINGEISKKLELSVKSMGDVHFAEYTSYLNIRKDKAMPYIWTGAAISMIGLIMGFYWHHRRIWLRIDKGVLSLGGHTNKNWFGLRNEVAAALKKQGLLVDPKQLDAGGERT